MTDREKLTKVREALQMAAEQLDAHARNLFEASELLAAHPLHGAIYDSHHDARRSADDARAALPILDELLAELAQQTSHHGGIEAEVADSKVDARAIAIPKPLVADKGLDSQDPNIEIGLSEVATGILSDEKHQCRWRFALESHLCKYDLPDWLHCTGEHGSECIVCMEAGEHSHAILMKKYPQAAQPSNERAPFEELEKLAEKWEYRCKSERHLHGMKDYCEGLNDCREELTAAIKRAKRLLPGGEDGKMLQRI